MWDDIIRGMRHFNGGILTGIDQTDRPAGFPCRPEPDHESKLLLISVADAPALRDGPASLLFRKHDERLVKLRSFLLRGRIQRFGDEWHFEPLALVSGQGHGGPFSYIRLLRTGRRNSRRYLARRGLARPQVEWTEIEELLAEARQRGPYYQA